MLSEWRFVVTESTTVTEKVTSVVARHILAGRDAGNHDVPPSSRG
jgi:hypothetical protein